MNFHHGKLLVTPQEYANSPTFKNCLFNLTLKTFKKYFIHRRLTKCPSADIKVKRRKFKSSLKLIKIANRKKFLINYHKNVCFLPSKVHFMLHLLNFAFSSHDAYLHVQGVGPKKEEILRKGATAQVCYAVFIFLFNDFFKAHDKFLFRLISGTFNRLLSCRTSGRPFCEPPRATI